MTELYLNGEGLMHQELVGTIKGFGVEGIRFGLDPFQESRNKAMLANINNMPWMKWHLLLHNGFFTDIAGHALSFSGAKDAFIESWNQIKPYLSADPWLENQWSLETGNEPTLAPTNSVFKDARVAASFWDYCYRIVRSQGFHTIQLTTPPAHNLDRYAGFHWTLRFLENVQEWDSNCRIGIHRYIPRWSAGPHEGWATRAAEQDGLDRLLATGDMQYNITETGISALRLRTRGFPLCWLPKRAEYLNHTEQGMLILSELMYWKGKADKVVLYQLNSGPDLRDPEHHFGIRDANEDWKGYAYLLGEVAQKYKEEIADNQTISRRRT